MRAKMEVTGVESFQTHERVSFRAVAKNGGYPEDGSDEDNTFAKFTPNGEAKFSIANPALFGKFEAGQRYYVDFTPAGDSA